MYLCQDLETEEQKNRFCLTERVCFFKTEEHKNRFLRTKYVFMFLCLKQKRLCLYVQKSKNHV